MRGLLGGITNIMPDKATHRFHGAAAPLTCRWRWRLRGLAYRRDENGATAVEFGLVALPLFTLIMGIVEISLFFAAGLVLEGASADASRLIRTGQAQMSGAPETMFSEALCDRSRTMLDCDRLQYEVIRVAGDRFGNAGNRPPAFDDDGNLIPQGFDAGNSNDVIMVRTVYRYEFLTPFLGAMITGDAGRNWSTHMSTVVIKSEPYIFGED